MPDTGSSRKEGYHHVQEEAIPDDEGMNCSLYTMFGLFTVQTYFLPSVLLATVGATFYAAAFSTQEILLVRKLTQETDKFSILE